MNLCSQENTIRHLSRQYFSKQFISADVYSDNFFQPFFQHILHISTMIHMNSCKCAHDGTHYNQMASFSFSKWTSIPCMLSACSLANLLLFSPSQEMIWNSKNNWVVLAHRWLLLVADISTILHWKLFNYNLQWSQDRYRSDQWHPV